MSKNHYDLIVVGLGAMGAAALYQASKRGARALGIDRFNPPHIMGSSHGETRITRQSIAEGEMYMPFIQRADEIWRELESFSGRELFLKSGGLIIEPQIQGASFHKQGYFVEESARTARKYGIAHEVLSANEANKRFPLLQMRPIDRAYYEPDTGVLRPELCIQTQLELAMTAGATLRTCEVVSDYQADSDLVQVFTDKGSYSADKLVLSAGAWIADLLPLQHRDNFKAYRQVIHWFEADDISAFYPENFPYLIWIGDTMEQFFTAFPAPRDGTQALKVVTEQYHTSTHPDQLDREVHPAEREYMFYELIAPRLKGVRENVIHEEVCMYTVTPDEHFVIDHHPESRRVIIASPCSGHGFKHSAAVGETLAQLALEGRAEFDISAFALSRLIDIPK